MNIQLERDRLLAPLGFTSSVVEKRQTLPILGNIYLKQEDGVLTLIGTDLETEVHTKIDAVDGENGETTITARKLYDICRSLPDNAQIRIKVKDEKALVTSSRSRFSLQTLPAKDFPRVEIEKPQVRFSIPQEDLVDLLEKTAFSMAAQDVRYYLNGLLWEFKGERLTLVATDGHRLAKTSKTIKGEQFENRQIIVPRKAVLELLRFLKSEQGEVVIEISDNHIRIYVSSLIFTSKLVDGRFPDYDKVIPKQKAHEIEIKGDAFHDVLSRASILTNDKFRGVRLALEQNKLIVSANNPEQEEAIEEMEIVFDEDPIEVGFNVSYLMDAVRAQKNKQFLLGLKDPNSSATITTENDPETIYIIMPMRL